MTRECPTCFGTGFVDSPDVEETQGRYVDCDACDHGTQYRCTGDASDCLVWGAGRECEACAWLAERRVAESPVQDEPRAGAL